ncbi:hypothetical protein P8C59_006927 [Phyllachora maydis]|uniref:diphosphoinositol-polyphosphate diphosphatase n=1 Tax=Phyllachora maydis TaxID=1825666 RepID=A0AAD9I8I0_9PEZI|nr:hypothetical protein P8C59_006927 [Phyllachora maydis]
MSEAAKRRVQAIGSQLAALGPSAESETIPPIKRVAPDSNGPRVPGKVVIITGANSALGIGRAAAHQFAQNGARAVYICDYNDTHLAAHQREMTAAWPEVDVHVRKFDAADESAVKELVDDALRRYGRLDVMFANAGIVGPPVSFADVDSEGFMETMRVNALSPFLAAKYAAPAMGKTTPEKTVASGSIILTASVAGLRANAGPTPYSASKAAVISMAQTLSYQLAGSNVRGRQCGRDRSSESKVVSKRNGRTFAEEGAEKELAEYPPKRSSKVCDSTSMSTSPASLVEFATAASMESQPLPDQPQMQEITGKAPFLAVDAAEALLPDVCRPANFGVVVPGVYRSSYPQTADYAFLQHLRLKTIVTLVQKEFPEGYKTFVSEHGIKHHVFDMKGTKKEEVPIKTMKQILRLVLDQQNHPLLIHCNHGKHRTGCVVAVVRKLSGWDLERVLEEYTTFAAPKVRDCDVAYITSFQLSALSNNVFRNPEVQIRVRAFYRATFFAFFVLLIWLVSCSRLLLPKRKKSWSD